MLTRWGTFALLVVMPPLITAVPFILRLRTSLTDDLLLGIYRFGVAMAAVLLFIAGVLIGAKTKWGWRAFFALLLAWLPTFMIIVAPLSSADALLGAGLLMIAVAGVNHVVLLIVIILTFRACGAGERSLFLYLLLSAYGTVILSSITPLYWKVQWPH